MAAEFRGRISRLCQIMSTALAQAARLLATAARHRYVDHLPAGALTVTGARRLLLDGECGRLVHLFRRRCRRPKPGSGRCLSLDAATAELQQARLLLEDADPGLRVRVRFPT